MKKRFSVLCLLALVFSLLFSSCSLFEGITDIDSDAPISLDDVPLFDGETQYVEINGNIPFFTDEERSYSYEKYSELDALGRCGAAIACIGKDIMPTEDREDIGHVTPSGWHSVTYDVVEGGYLYNRCHLIGFQLAGENDNEKNLITGTKYMNNGGMLFFENKVAKYVKNTGNRVLYRATPIYDETDLVARGVLMEAQSVGSDDLVFCVYVYNAQPGINIDYKTGESRLASDPLGEVVGANHDAADILPAGRGDSVDEMYIETVSDEYSGVLVTSKVNGDGGLIFLATDVDENGRVVSVKVLSQVEKKWGSAMNCYVSDFAGKSAEQICEIQAPDVNPTAAAAIKRAVLEAISAVELYTDAEENGEIFIANRSSKKFHLESCGGAATMAEHNKLVYIGYPTDLIEAGYTPCGTCNPAK